MSDSQSAESAQRPSMVEARPSLVTENMASPEGSQELSPSSPSDQQKSAKISEEEKKAKKRGYVIQEIISTELTYVDRLKLAIDHIIMPLRTLKILDVADSAGQFELLERIYDLHTRNSVDGSASQNLKFVGLFNAMASNLEIYSAYLVNYEAAMQRRGHLLTKNRKFADFIAKVEKDPAVNQTLESLLILPVQRIPRYRLLLEQLLKYTPPEHVDYTSVQAALDQICAMASYNNEAIRARENQKKIMDVVMSLDMAYRIDLLEDKNRVHIKEGPLLKQCRKRYKEFQFWLFSDVLLYGEKTPLGAYTVNRQLHLSKVKVTLPAETEVDAAVSFIIESPAKSFKVKTRREDERKDWVAAITEAIDKQRSSRQTTETQVAPLWKPDSNSNQCELCHATFTLLFRRHHCRHCGRLCCDPCSTHRFLLQHLHATVPVRVCDVCFKKLSSSAEGSSTHATKDSATRVSEDEEEEEDDDDDSDDREEMDERESVSEGELDDFNDYMKAMEQKPEAAAMLAESIDNNNNNNNTAKPANEARGLRIPLLFARNPPAGGGGGAAAATAAAGGKETAPLWPFRRNSAVAATSTPPPPPPPATPGTAGETRAVSEDIALSSSPLSSSSATSGSVPSVTNNPARMTLLAEEVVRSLHNLKLTQQASTGGGGGGGGSGAAGVPPPKPPRRNSSLNANTATNAAVEAAATPSEQASTLSTTCSSSPPPPPPSSSSSSSLPSTLTTSPIAEPAGQADVSPAARRERKISRRGNVFVQLPPPQETAAAAATVTSTTTAGSPSLSQS